MKTHFDLSVAQDEYFHPSAPLLRLYSFSSCKWRAASKALTYHNVFGLVLLLGLCTLLNRDLTKIEVDYLNVSTAFSSHGDMGS